MTPSQNSRKAQQQKQSDVFTMTCTIIPACTYNDMVAATGQRQCASSSTEKGRQSVCVVCGACGACVCSGSGSFGRVRVYFALRACRSLSLCHPVCLRADRYPLGGCRITAVPFPVLKPPREPPWRESAWSCWWLDSVMDVLS